MDKNSVYFANMPPIFASIISGHLLRWGCYRLHFSLHYNTSLEKDMFDVSSKFYNCKRNINAVKPPKPDLLCIDKCQILRNIVLFLDLFYASLIA